MKRYRVDGLEFAIGDWYLREVNEDDKEASAIVLVKEADHLAEMAKLREELESLRHLHDVAVKERDLERVQNNNLRAENERLRALLGRCQQHLEIAFAAARDDYGEDEEQDAFLDDMHDVIEAARAKLAAKDGEG